jgi:hypothetical protein
MSVVRERFAAALRAEFARTGDACLLAAAAILEPAMPGRAAIDDSGALERLAELLAARPEMRLYTLALRVARELDEPMTSRRSTAARLVGKYRRAHGAGAFAPTPPHPYEVCALVFTPTRMQAGPS